jgi:NAD(P)-dependent dehydrogenase (short-subunit alcohol dehydrogenase family)
MANDVLGYAGRRVIVAGAASEIGVATTKLLVDLGAEVHAIDTEKPVQAGLASFTQADLRDAAQIEAAARKIGRVVNALFDCAALANDDGTSSLHRLTEHVVPLMIEGAAIASVASLAGGEVFPVLVVNDYVAERTRDLLASGVRINCVNAVAAGRAEDHAWPLVLLNSPRAALVTGAVLPLG